MGLFDNLFLDKNTPMQINTGAEKTVISDDPKNPPSQERKEDKSETVIPFENIENSDISLEISSLNDKNPSQEHDTSLTDADINNSSVDIHTPTTVDFDIGWDIAGLVSIPLGDAIERVDSVLWEEKWWEVSMSFLSGMIHPVSNVVFENNDEPHISIESTELLTENTVETPKITEEENKNTDNALFTLLGENTSWSGEIKNIPSREESKNIDTSSIFWISSTASKDVSHQKKDIDEEKKLHNLTDISQYTEKTLWTIVSEQNTKKIREILKQSIYELHKVEVEDTFLKAELMQQLLEYDLRIEKVEEKTNNELSILKNDRHDLEIKMKKLAHESRVIKNLLTSLEKHLEIAG